MTTASAEDLHLLLQISEEDEGLVYLRLLILAVTSGGLRSGAGGRSQKQREAVRRPVFRYRRSVQTFKRVLQPWERRVTNAEPSRRFGSGPRGSAAPLRMDRNLSQG